MVEIPDPVPDRCYVSGESEWDSLFLEIRADYGADDEDDLQLWISSGGYECEHVGFSPDGLIDLAQVIIVMADKLRHDNLLRREAV